MSGLKLRPPQGKSGSRAPALIAFARMPALQRRNRGHPKTHAPRASHGAPGESMGLEGFPVSRRVFRRERIHGQPSAQAASVVSSSAHSSCVTVTLWLRSWAAVRWLRVRAYHSAPWRRCTDRRTFPST
jgi:hypothetical protein